MVRLSLVLAALVVAASAAQADYPSSRPVDSAAQPATGNTYMVFFEARKAGLTPEAQEILLSAAEQAKAMRLSSVRVLLPASASGMTSLLRGRVRAVKAELVRDGVSPLSIGNADEPEDIAYSKADPMVRAWFGRSLTVEVVPIPIADSDGRVG